jgi:hypothetical protein
MPDTLTEPIPVDPNALCGWAHAELGRLTKMSELLGQFGRRWKARAAACRDRGEHDRAKVIEDMLGEMAEIMSRSGRAGPHADHLRAAQFHIAAYITATRPAART